MTLDWPDLSPILFVADVQQPMNRHPRATSQLIYHPDALQLRRSAPRCRISLFFLDHVRVDANASLIFRQVRAVNVCNHQAWLVDQSLAVINSICRYIFHVFLWLGTSSVMHIYIYVSHSFLLFFCCYDVVSFCCE